MVGRSTAALLFSEFLCHWLHREESGDREDRLRRLKWLAANVPTYENWVFHDGIASQVLFEEARYCFVYGQFVAVVLLGVAFLERSIAARLFGAGASELERKHLPTLLPEAQARGWLTSEECARIDALRELRNPLVHYRQPIDPSRFEWRALNANASPYAIFEQDARAVIETALHYVGRSAI